MSTLNLSPPLDRTRLRSLTVEQVAYLVLGLIALIAHLWALGDRSLHHDETLHASYSWYLLVGRGYIHDPLLHGPLLYYLGALGYFLFGDSDFTARLMPALAGTALTLTPYLLRRELGRPAALIAAVYLLISPVALYVGRFFRHDIYSVLCELLVFVAVVRYVSTYRRFWLLVGSAAFGLMFVNQETSYLFLLIMAVPLIIAWLWQIYKPAVALVALLGLAVAALVFVLPGDAKVDAAHHGITDPLTGELQVEQPGLFGWAPLPTDDNGYALRIRNRADNDSGQSLLVNLGSYLGELLRFFGHPAILLAMGLSVSVLAALIYLIWYRRNATGQTPWTIAQANNQPAVPIALHLGERRNWLVALLLFLAIYLVFFTAFFTNIIGAISGVAGSLLYWLAQHNVERGGQPAHYYLFQLAVYEPLLLIFGALGLALIGYDRIRQQRQMLKTPKRTTPLSPPFAILLLAWWTVAAFAIYTWAGEKMPWLTIHISLPLTLLMAWTVQRMIWGGIPVPDGPGRAPDLPKSAWVVSGFLFTAVLGLGFVVMTAVIGLEDAATVVPFLTPALILGVGLLLMILLTVGAGLRWGWRGAAAILTVCMSLSIGFYTARSAIRLAYINGDVAREPLVYTQTSPDMMQVIRRLEEASIRRGRGLDMPVIYDNETIWSWYLRNFTRAERTSGQLSAPPAPEVMAVLLLQENFDRYQENRNYLEGFVIQRHPLRWWFPEDEIYRLNPNWREAPLDQISLVGQLLRAPLDRDVGERWWNFLLFRDPGRSLGSTDVVIAVRSEIADQIGPGFGRPR